MGRKLVHAATLILLLAPGPGVRAARVVFTPEEIRQALAERLGPDDLRSLKIPFEATEDVRALAAEVTRGAHGEQQKLAALLSYFRHQGYLERYDQTGTRTASEVLHTGEGNCLSYANLFVAMARSVGLRAVYLDASEVVHELKKSGSVLVHVGHILVGVQSGPELTTVDFDGRRRRSGRYDVMSDLQAMAEFYSNLGYELSWLLRDEGGFASRRALRAFHLATRICPDFARSWNNLGVALGRAGNTRRAEAAYRRALRADPGLAAPHANLGQLLLRRGETAEAVDAFTRAVRLDPGNAHYRYFLGKALASAGRLERARSELESGTRLDPDLFLLHMQLAEVCMRLGDRHRAGTAARRVLELVPHHRDATRLVECLRDPLCNG